MSQESEKDEKIGARARDLLRALSDFTDMLSLDVPTPVLARQLDEMETIAKDVDDLAGSSLFENDVFGTLGDPSKLMKLYDLLQYRQAQKPE